MKVRCPICRKSAPWEGNPFRPFCSERCKLIDLGQWLDESYRIPEESEGLESTKDQNPQAVPDKPARS